MQATLNQQPSHTTSQIGLPNRVDPSLSGSAVCLSYPDLWRSLPPEVTRHEHMKMHTWEQPYQCPIEGCGKHFNTSGNVARHRKLHAI
ncbi:unnamed protein product [Peronospora destructor]|uniref:C2H2-type domain-containing protein n=1 Tax=Peronospora destructor TaxID=86335 RepID=A0AAV0URL1_9STRA|nr:unnamed protein product [Peronospora destructor]